VRFTLAADVAGCQVLPGLVRACRDRPAAGRGCVPHLLVVGHSGWPAPHGYPRVPAPRNRARRALHRAWRKTR